MFGNVNWRARVVAITGAALMLAGVVVVDSLPLVLLGLAVIVGAFFLDRYLKRRA